MTSGGGATSAAGASCSPASRSCHPISCGKVFLCQFPTEFARPGSDHVLRTPATPTLAAVYNRAPLQPLITRSQCSARVSRDLALSSRRSRAHYQLITMSGSVIISDLETLQNSKNSLAAARNKFFARKIHKLKKVCISSTMITVTYLLDVFKHLSKLEILNLYSKFYVDNTNTV